jgi:hypothetical protein
MISPVRFGAKRSNGRASSLLPKLNVGGSIPPLQDELNQVKPLAYRYQTGQARQWEVARLERTVDRITREVRG